MEYSIVEYYRIVKKSCLFVIHSSFTSSSKHGNILIILLFEISTRIEDAKESKTSILLWGLILENVP